MSRYLYGKVIVRTVTIEADDEQKALVILNDIETDHGNKKVLNEYELHWGETDKTNITRQRDGVLAEFLNLMQNEIPRGSATSLILPQSARMSATEVRHLKD